MVYKIGKTVVIKDSMVIGKAYGNCEFVPEMQEFEGEKVKIIAVKEYMKGRFNYRIKEDNGLFEWNFKMFI